MDASYRLLQPGIVEDEWGAIRTHLKRAVEKGHGEVLVDDILTMVLDGRMGVLALIENGKIVAATAFEVISYPRRKVMNLAFHGGRGTKVIAENYQTIENIARRLGVDAVVCHCRPSVARLLRMLDPGTKQTYVTIEKKVPR